MKKAPRATTLVLALILLTAGGLYTLAVTRDNFGFIHDDGIYLTTAKALATGAGYRIISLPGEPVETKSPPFYPFLLSLLWRISPHFPQNLSMMMMLSVAAGLASLLIAWLYLTRFGYASRWRALLIVSLVAFNWRTVLLATGLYSEMFYMALSIGALFLAELYEDLDRKWSTGVAVGVVIGLALLTRTAGIVLLFAIPLHYLLRRRIRRCALPVAVGALFVLGWSVWGYLHQSSGFGESAAYHETYVQTLRIVVSESQNRTNSSEAGVLLSIVGNNVKTLSRIAIPWVIMALPYQWPENIAGSFRMIALGIVIIPVVLMCFGFVRQCRSGFRLVHAYVILYLLLHLLWPYAGQDRFMMPLLPFILLFLTVEVTWFFALLRKESGGGTRGVIIAVTMAVAPAFIGVLPIYYYGAGVKSVLTSAKHLAAKRAEADKEAIAWINENTNPTDVLVSYRDPTYYLYTGRKAVRCSPLREGGLLWGAGETPRHRAERIFRILAESDAQFLVSTETDLELEGQADAYLKAYRAVLEENPETFVPVFRSSDTGCVIYRIEDQSKSRTFQTR